MTPRAGALWPAATLACACVVAGAPGVAKAAATGAPILAVTGAEPQAVRAADLDGDCVDELVVGGVGGLEVLVPDRGGAYRTAWRNDSIPPVADLELADLDGDGRLDAVAAHRQGDRITVHLGTGEAAFAAPMEVLTPRGPNAIAVADIDGDGYLDVVTAYQLAGSVGVFRGDGAGGLTPLGEIGGFTLPWDVAAGDLDGDGNVDLVVTDYFADALVRLLGDGAGGFVESGRRADLGGPLEVGIVPGDRRIVCIARDAAMLIALDGELTTTDARPTGPDPEDLHLVDATGDARLDAVVADAVVADVRVYPGSSAGFTTPFGAPLLVPARAATAGDLDGDGTRDAVAVTGPVSGQPNGWVWIAHRDAGAEIVARTDRALDTAPDAVLVTDVTGDGRPDLLVATDGDADLRLHPGSGAGFGSGTGVPLEHPAAAVDAADVNGDGRTDIIVAYADVDSVGTYLGGNGGVFMLARTVAMPPRPTHVRLADLDGDTAPDAVVTHEADDLVTVLIGDGSGGFALRESLPAGSTPGAPVVADVDADGAPDLLIAARFDGDVRVYRGEGDGSFAAPVLYPTGSLATGVAVYDATGDGVVDLFAASASATTLSLRPGDGSGGFGDAIVTDVADSFDAVALTDVDGDGELDAIVSREPVSRVVAWLGRSDGTFGDARTLDGGVRPHRILTADVDGDGHQDLVVVRRPGSAQVVTVFAGRDPSPAARVESFTAIDVAEGVEVRVRLASAEGVETWIVSRLDAAEQWIDVYEEPVVSRDLRWLDPEAREPGLYRYRVHLVDAGLETCTTGTVSVTVAARAFALLRASPSPFRDRTSLRVTLPPGGARVRTEVFDVGGRRVARLPDRRLPAGVSEIVWDGHTDAGSLAAPGVYWARVTADGHAAAVRVVVAR